MSRYPRFDEIDLHDCVSEEERALARAIDRLIERDGLLFEMRAHERALAFRLALYLADEVDPALDVDSEFCRMRDSTSADGVSQYVNKRMERSERCRPDATRGEGDVFPDIVVHRRGEPDNRLVIEAKRFARGSAPDVACDVEKLEAFAEQDFDYRVCVMLWFDLDAKGSGRVRVFRLGG